MSALASVLKPLAKAGLAHPLLVWMPAVMRDSWIRGYKSQKTSHGPFRTGLFPNGTGSSAQHQSRPDVIF
eukprot:1138746-Pelagomonas_calceolata.AAC.1